MIFRYFKIKALFTLLVLLCCTCMHAQQVNGSSYESKVIEVRINKNQKKKVQINFCLPEKIRITNPIVFINDKEVPTSAVRNVDVRNIEKIEVVQDDEAIRRYGEKAKGGVILIYTKDYNIRKVYT